MATPLNAFAKRMVQLTNHMLELRSRIMYIVLSGLFSFTIAYCKSTQLIYVFLLSFTLERSGNSVLSNTATLQRSFIFTDVYEAFSSQVFVCLIACSLCTLPLAVYQSVCFFLPSWYVYEKKNRCKRILVIFFCWVQYMYFVHSVIIPKLCYFFLQFQIKKDCLTVTVEPKIVSYVSWSANLFALATFIFLLACSLYLYTLYRRLDIKDWGKKRKPYIFFCLLCASLVSPPELWSQFFCTLILLSLCELFVWVHFVSHRMCRERDKEEVKPH